MKPETPKPGPNLYFFSHANQIFISVTSACFSLLWELIEALRGGASYGALLSLGPGCQKWTPLDVPGTQPRISDAVVNTKRIY